MLTNALIVGKVITIIELIFAKGRKCLFPISLIDATKQDGGSRERKEQILHLALSVENVK